MKNLVQMGPRCANAAAAGTLRHFFVVRPSVNAVDLCVCAVGEQNGTKNGSLASGVAPSRETEPAAIGRFSLLP